MKGYGLGTVEAIERKDGTVRYRARYPVPGGYEAAGTYDSEETAWNMLKTIAAERDSVTVSGAEALAKYGERAFER